MKHKYTLNVNGRDFEIEADGAATLLEVLRDNLGLTGTKEGCGRGECGACTVIINKRAVNSCLLPVSQAEKAEIITIEGLSEAGKMDLIQEMFIKHGAIQCGYCTPGMIMSVKALLMRDDNPSEDVIRTAIAGNLCRCTGYKKIIQAVKETVILLNSVRKEMPGHKARPAQPLKWK